MAVNEIRVSASPEEVFRVLSDPRRYAEWVVGADRVRGADETWPSPGSSFYHTFGVGPVKVKDSTTVLECVPPRRLVLKARAWPFGAARITLQVEPDAGGSRIVMDERPMSPRAARLWNPVFDQMTRGRNAEALRRLRTIVEEVGAGA